MTNLELTFYQDGENRVPIPAGFAVSQVEGENKVDKGLVIIDSDGNEFVWIPCGTKQADGTYSTMDYEGAKDYVVSKNWSSYAYNYQAGTGSTDVYKAKTWENPEEQIKIAKESIEKYGGFYVARFEAGVPSNAPFHISHTSGDNYVGVNNKNGVSTTENNVNARGADSETAYVKDLKPVSKRGVQAWNLISQPNAKTVSENMYKDSNSVDSYLIDSNAWNHICQSIFIDKFKLDVRDSTTYGNYSNNKTTDYTKLDCLWAKHENNDGWKYATEYKKGNITTDIVNGRTDNSKKYRIELATGASDDFKIYNIYDMAGNMWEWTTEVSTGIKNSNGQTTPSKDYAVCRGGSLANIGESNQIVQANGASSKSTDYSGSVGFRVVIYVK